MRRFACVRDIIRPSAGHALIAAGWIALFVGSEQAGVAQGAMPTWYRWVPVVAILVLIFGPMIYWQKS